MDRCRLEEEQRAVEARREQQLEDEHLRRQSLESTEPLLEMPPTVVSESSVDARPSGLTASQERSVVDENYVQGVQSPQASMISKTLGIDSQAAKEFQPVLTSRLQSLQWELQRKARLPSRVSHLCNWIHQ